MPKYQLIPDRQEHDVFVFTTPDSMSTKHFCSTKHVVLV